MALSSINFKRSSAHSPEHNDRTLSPSYLLPIEMRQGVLVNRSAKEARDFCSNLIAEAAANFTERTGQKPQWDANAQKWSAVVNIKPTTTLQDLENLVQHFEQKFGWQNYQIAIHRDEGHINERGIAQLNQHAHLEFLMINRRGITAFKKRDFGKKEMSEIQTEVAEILGMQRGASKLETKRERFEPRQFKQHMREIERVQSDDKKTIRKLEKKVENLKKKNSLTKKRQKELIELERKRWISDAEQHSKEDYRELSKLKDQIFDSEQELLAQIEALKIELEKSKRLEIENQLLKNRCASLISKKCDLEFELEKTEAEKRQLIGWKRAAQLAWQVCKDFIFGGKGKSEILESDSFSELKSFFTPQKSILSINTRTQTQELDATNREVAQDEQSATEAKETSLKSTSPILGASTDSEPMTNAQIIASFRSRRKRKNDV